MRIINLPVNVILTFTLFLMIGSCIKKEEDACLKSEWLQVKELEIKLAVHVMPTNPNLPGGTPGSLSPIDFEKMTVNGTIEKIECNEQTTGPVSLGNTYLNRGVDFPAPIDVPKAWWIGHVVYVYEFGNDNDHLNINLTIKITMQDNQSYMCNVSEGFFYPQIVQVQGEMYYYILLDIYSDYWIKV